MIRNHHPGPGRKVWIGATGGIGHDQFLDSGSRELLVGAAAFIKMRSPLRKSDSCTADFIEHETPEMSFHGRSWNFANVRVRNDAIAVHIADETVELRFSQDLGNAWTEPIRPFSTTVEGISGSLRVVYITELDDRWPPPDCGSTAHPIPANRFSIPLISLSRECEHAGVSFGRASSPSERHPPVLRT